jgi:hypothetical protein
MAISSIGMLLAAVGYLSPVAGAIGQEIIDVFAVVNALRVAIPPGALTDFRIQRGLHRGLGQGHAAPPTEPETQPNAAR